MTKFIYLYTPWREQGLSYDAKVIEDIALKYDFQPIITYRTKRKIEWECDYMSLKEVLKKIQPHDIFFSFEVFPENYISYIAEKTQNLFHMINYEYYDKSLFSLHSLYKNIFCKSLICLQGCKADGLKNIIYMPWILYKFPIYNFSPLKTNKIINIIFNGGTGGYIERRNLESIISLIYNYQDNDVKFTIKINKKIQRWTKSILNKNKTKLLKDNRVTIEQNDFSRKEYIKFLSKYDLNLAPSKFEGFGLTILESQYLNIPTITLDASPMNEIIKHNITGICLKSFNDGFIGSQPIYNVKPKIFLNEFTNLIKNKNKITTMKTNITKSVLESENRFNNYFKNNVFTK